MRCLILDNCSSALQIVWQRALAQRLRSQGHDVVVHPGGHPLHHEGLRAALREHCVFGRIAIWESDTYPEYADWARVVDRYFEDPDVGLVGAQHGWRHLSVRSTERVTSAHIEWPGDYRPIADNAAAWWCVLDLDRLRDRGIAPGDLDWEPTGYKVLFRDGVAIGHTGGDTGARIVPKLAAAGLRSVLFPVRLRPVGHGADVVVPAEDEVDGQRWLAYHHFFGRHIGRNGEHDVGHHVLSCHDITQCALSYMKSKGMF